jgi:hypothetical protein
LSVAGKFTIFLFQTAGDTTSFVNQGTESNATLNALSNVFQSIHLALANLKISLAAFCLLPHFSTII